MNGLKNATIEPGDRILPHGSTVPAEVTRVGPVNDHGTRKVYYRIASNGLSTYGMDYQMRRAPAPGPHLLDNGKPTYASSIEKSHGSPPFWSGAERTVK